MNRLLNVAAIFIVACSSVASAQTTRPSDDDSTVAISEAVITAPVDEIWRVFSTDDGFTKLGVAKAKIDLHFGGMIWSSYDPKIELGSEGSIGTEILAIDPGHVIATHIKQPPKGFPFTTAHKTVTNTITLTDLGDGRTHLRIAMHGYDASDESQKMRDFFRKGNAWVLQKLQSSYGGDAPTRGAHVAGPLDPIELEQLVDAPRDEVWKAYTTPGGWKAFFGLDNANVGTLPGDPFVPFPGTEGNTVLSTVPGEMLSHTWNAPPQFAFAKGQHSWVVVTFDAVSPTKTRVRLRHFGFNELAAKHPDHADEFKGSRQYFAEKWPMLFGKLAKHFEKTAS
jgi:uncharacterized protein YndB with AHSA1/START domain